MAQPSKSRLTLARAAIRPAMWGRVMLAGPSGAGKTWTSLVIADTLHDPEENPTKRTLVIDTEKESALTYADVFDFEHLPWKAPFDPRELADTLLDRNLGAEYDVVIVDSFSHFWSGSGGVLDTADGRFGGWKDARPMQVDVVEAILNCDAHVIVCVREKQEFAQTTDTNGKHRVEKLGMAPVQDSTFEYEVNVSLAVDMTHILHVSKSRTAAVPVGTQYKPGHAADFAVHYRDWLRAGEPVAGKDVTDALIERFKAIHDESERIKVKRVFLDCFGRPEFLLVSKVAEAEEWIDDMVRAANGGATMGAATGERAPDEVPAEANVPDDAPDDAQAPTAAQAGAQEPEAPDPAQQRAQAIADQVNAMTVDEVRAGLVAAGLTENGAPKTLRQRLARHLISQPVE